MGELWDGEFANNNHFVTNMSWHQAQEATGTQVDRKSSAEQQWYNQRGTSGYWINVSLDTRIKETSSKARSFRPPKNMKQDHIKAQRKARISTRTGAQQEDSWIHGAK